MSSSTAEAELNEDEQAGLELIRESSSIHQSDFWKELEFSSRKGSRIVESLVSTIMDDARRFIANETDRNVDITEKADTALVGLTAQLLETDQADHVILLTTDKPAGRAAETLLPQHGFSDRLEYRYVSVEYLETITADEFR